MTDQPWWERWPKVLEREHHSLSARGFGWRRDEAALNKGILRLDITVPIDGKNVCLSVVYPDAYPYFRFQVYAPTLNLPFHQNPFNKNLCLIGRRTHFWNPDDTAADLIAEQLPVILKTAKATESKDVEGLEQRQAEPFSDYYPYAPSMLLVQTDWHIPPDCRSGTFKVGTLPINGNLPETLLRGVLLDIRSDRGDVLCTADDELAQAYCGKEFEGRWGRINKPIETPDAGQFITELLRIHPALRQTRCLHVKDGWLQVWGAVFPEQTAHRVLGEGWIFACALYAKHPHADSERSDKARRPKKHKTRKKW